MKDCEREAGRSCTLHGSNSSGQGVSCGGFQDLQLEPIILTSRSQKPA